MITPSKPQVVVCAAIVVEGVVHCGIRHGCPAMRTQFMDHTKFGKDDQGFLDNWGNFLSRTEAWKVAEAAGQIRYRVNGDTRDGGTLYSENLY